MRNRPRSPLESRRRHLPVVACAVLAIGLAAAGAAGLARAGDGTRARDLTVDGVPILEVAPATRPASETPSSETPSSKAPSSKAPATGRPAAVVAHGFSGSATLMRGFADTLAARGYVVVLPDFAGHGRNSAPLTGEGTVTGRLQRDLAAAVRHLRAQPSVDPSRIVLVGHSMGADAVVAYAAADPGIRATVAISLSSTGSLPDHAARPRNLLLIVGAAEFPEFHRNAREALHRADPAAAFGDTVGDQAAGTGRRAVLVPGTEHVSVLFAAGTHAEVVAWLDAAVDHVAEEPLHPRDRLVPAGLLLLGLLVGFVPLAAGLPRGRPGTAAGLPATTPRVRGRYAYPGLGIALVLAVAGAGALPTARLPLAVGGHVVGFFALVGAGLLATCWYRWRPVRWPPALWREVRWREVRWREVGMAALLVGYAVVAVAVPMHLGVTRAVPVGDRWWLLPIVVAGVAVLLAGTELVAAAAPWRQPLALAATALALLAATVAGTAPGFVVLVAPVLVALFAWHCGWSVVLRRRDAPVWLRVLVGATVVGWPIAVTLPLTG